MSPGHVLFQEMLGGKGVEWFSSLMLAGLHHNEVSTAVLRQQATRLSTHIGSRQLADWQLAEWQYCCCAGQMASSPTW
jgi:hypothetical protein